MCAKVCFWAHLVVLLLCLVKYKLQVSSSQQTCSPGLHYIDKISNYNAEHCHRIGRTGDLSIQKGNINVCRVELAEIHESMKMCLYEVFLHDTRP